MAACPITDIQNGMLKMVVSGLIGEIFFTGYDETRAYLAVRELVEEIGSEDSHTSVLCITGLEVLQMQCTHCVSVNERLKSQDTISLDGSAHGADSLSDNSDD